MLAVPVAFTVRIDAFELDGCDFSVPPATSVLSALEKDEMPLVSEPSALICAVFVVCLLVSAVSRLLKVALTRLLTSDVVSMPEPAPSDVRIELPADESADWVEGVDVVEEVVVIASVPVSDNGRKAARLSGSRLAGHG